MPAHFDEQQTSAAESRWLERLTSGHEVHIWQVVPEEVTDEAQLARFRDLMSPVECARNARFVFAKHRHADLVTRALVRTTLSLYRPSVDPRDWQFEAGPYGRPAVTAPTWSPDVAFNLSHTDGMAVCMVAFDREIGVDVEDATRIGLSEIEIANRYFSSAEAAALRLLPGAAQVDRFFDYWTLKESYIKARGLGLQIPLDQFSLQIGVGEPIGIAFGPEIADDPMSWQFELRSLSTRHRLAVAIRRRDEPDLVVRTYRAPLSY